MHLSKSPNKKAEVIQRLTTKYKLRINLKENRGRRRKELNEDKKISLIEFLNRSDIMYTNPGRKDHVYTGKFNGERKYKQRQYLLWPLRDILPITNSNTGSEESFEGKFGKEITFSQLYDYLKLQKKHSFNSVIPHTSYLYEMCENSSLLAKGLNNRKRIFRENFSINLITW